jgi:hypothetical protein
VIQPQSLVASFIFLHLHDPVNANTQSRVSWVSRKAAPSDSLPGLCEPPDDLHTGLSNSRGFSNGEKGYVFKKPDSGV